VIIRDAPNRLTVIAASLVEVSSCAEVARTDPECFRSEDQTMALSGPAEFGEFQPEDLIGELNEVERKNAPSSIFVAGNHALLTEERLRVSVVGTREPTEDGVKRTRSLVQTLVSRQIIVVSGLAKGVDTIAHTTALNGGGETIAVLGTPLNVFYPAENRELQRRIMRDHLAVSQFPIGMHVGTKGFPIRNRTMALLSDATIIIEAGDGSGTLHQGWEALRLGRPLFLLESLVKDPNLTWPKEMIHYGATALNREDLDTVLHEIPWRTKNSEPAF